jgi:hypothetical protein
MCECACEAGEAGEKLAELLIIVEMRKTVPVEYSLEREAVLWDGGDRVEEQRRTFYVALRHFSGEIIGRHVGLSGGVVRSAGGETRTYRLQQGAGKCVGEHLSLYVYNPGVNKNGALSFAMCGRDKCQRVGVCVAPDTCPAVVKWECARMQGGLETELVNKEDGYVIKVRILFPRLPGEFSKYIEALKGVERI